jgi:hypothetical protein
MAASINLKSSIIVTNNPQGIVRNDYGSGVSSEVTVVMLQWLATWPEF